MKKITHTLLIVVIFISSCSKPLYKPGNLVEKENYSHLLQNNNETDEANFFRINDSISLYYFTEGTGENILVIHGGPGFPFTEKWAGLDNLTNDYKFYYYHQRGCGKSSRPIDKFESKNFYKNMKFLDENLGLPAQISDIEQIRLKIGKEKITIIGHSFGGFLATLYAIEFPEHVKSLILVSPAEVVKMPSESGGLYELIRQELSGKVLIDYEIYLKEFFNYGKLFSKTEEQLAKENYDFIKYYNIATKDTSKTEYSTKDVGGWIQHACFLSMGKKHDYSKSLSEIKCPVLIIHGEDDIIPPSSCNQYLDYIPQAKLETIKNANHFLFNQKPDEFNKIVTTFLKNEIKD